jgi:predicted RNA binding protein YcfA (HicA-like mRNA interferase family)
VNVAVRRGSITKRISIRMARKIRELIQDLKKAGFYEIPGGGKGSHHKFTHVKYPGAVTLSGKSGDDAKPYQERQVKQAIEEVEK